MIKSILDEINNIFLSLVGCSGDTDMSSSTGDAATATSPEAAATKVEAEVEGKVDAATAATTTVPAAAAEEAAAALDNIIINGTNVDEYGDSQITISEGESNIFTFTASSNNNLLVPEKNFIWGLSDSPDDAKDENGNPRFKINDSGEFSFVTPVVYYEEEEKNKYVMSVVVLSLDGVTRLTQHTIRINVIKA